VEEGVPWDEAIDEVELVVAEFNAGGMESCACIGLEEGVCLEESVGLE
jgi:hypothetical protein